MARFVKKITAKTEERCSERGVSNATSSKGNYLMHTRVSIINNNDYTFHLNFVLKIDLIDNSACRNYNFYPYLYVCSFFLATLFL